MFYAVSSDYLLGILVSAGHLTILPRDYLYLWLSYIKNIHNNCPKLSKMQIVSIDQYFEAKISTFDSQIVRKNHLFLSFKSKNVTKF